MVFLGLIFVTMLGIVFTVVALMIRPTAEQKTVNDRIAVIIGQQIRPGTSYGMDSHLTLAEPPSLGRVDDLIGDLAIYRRLQKLILQSQSKSSGGAVLATMASLSVSLLALCYFLTSMLPVACMGAIVASYLPIGVLRFRAARRIAAFDAVLPDCIELCARALRAGHSIVSAIDMVASQAMEPAKTEFSEVFKKQNYGLPLRDALMQMLDRVPSMDLQVMVTGILVQKDTGGNLAEILDRIVFVTRERSRIQREIRTNTAQGRLTGWILCLLPIAMLLVINVVNPGYSSILFHDPRGKKMLYAGLVLLLTGALVIRHIINGIEV